MCCSAAHCADVVRGMFMPASRAASWTSPEQSTPARDSPPHTYGTPCKLLTLSRNRVARLAPLLAAMLPRPAGSFPHYSYQRRRYASDGGARLAPRPYQHHDQGQDDSPENHVKDTGHHGPLFAIGPWPMMPPPQSAARAPIHDKMLLK